MRWNQNWIDALGTCTDADLAKLIGNGMTAHAVGDKRRSLGITAFREKCATRKRDKSYGARNEKIAVCLSISEKEGVESAAERLGMTASEVVRNLVLSISKEVK